MDFLSDINPVVAIGVLCMLCAGTTVLVLLLSVISGLLDVVMFVFETAFNLVQSGPMGCCGCLVAIIACGGCLFFILTVSGILQSCGTPDAVNFCRLF